MDSTLLRHRAVCAVTARHLSDINTPISQRRIETRLPRGGTFSAISKFLLNVSVNVYEKMDKTAAAWLAVKVM